MSLAGSHEHASKPCQEPDHKGNANHEGSYEHSHDNSVVIDVRDHLVDFGVGSGCGWCIHQIAHDQHCRPRQSCKPCQSKLNASPLVVVRCAPVFAPTGAASQEILSAARRLFAAKGYKATKLAEIASEAGVSPQTIYDSVGSKSTVLAQIVDGMEAEVGLHEMIEQSAAITDPAGLIKWQIDLSRRFIERCGDIVRALDSGTGEPEIREINEEGRRRHNFGGKLLIGGLVELGALDADAHDLDRLADILSALTFTDTFIALIDHYGWTLDEVCELLYRLLVREILGDSHLEA